MSRGTVLITGASSGIGEALARLFSREGFDLILTARRAERLEALKTELGEYSTVNVVPIDLATSNGASDLINAVSQIGMPVDILVNNAGTMPEGDFDKLDAVEIDHIINLNVRALTHLTNHFFALMLAARNGRILNVASVAAFHPVAGMDIYAATKAYVLSLTESLAEQARGTGVSLTALCPGLTNTEMVDQSLTRSLPSFVISTPEVVAQEGFDALMRKDVICVPGKANKLALTWAQHQPRWLVRGLGGLASRFGKIR